MRENYAGFVLKLWRFSPGMVTIYRNTGGMGIEF